MITWKSCRPEVFLQISQNSQENKSNFQFCEISKNTFFSRTPPMDASVHVALNKSLPYIASINRFFYFCLLLRISCNRNITQNTAQLDHRIFMHISPLTRDILNEEEITISTLHKEWSFSERIILVNASKSTGNCGFVRVAQRNSHSKLLLVLISSFNDAF